MTTPLQCGHRNPGSVEATSDEVVPYFLHYLGKKKPKECFPCYYRRMTGKELTITRP